jgi:hypothetical protein
MINQQILEYIHQQIQLGTPKDSIRSSLKTGGWVDTDIDEAFNSMTPIPPPPPVAVEPTPITVTPVTPVTPPVSQPSQPTQTVQPHASHSKAIIGSVIVLLLLVGTGVYAWMTQLQTSPEEIAVKAMLPIASETTKNEEPPVTIADPQDAWLEMQTALDNTNSYDEVEIVIRKYGSKSTVDQINANAEKVKTLPTEFKNQLAALFKTPAGVTVTGSTETKTDTTANLNFTTSKTGLTRTVSLVLENNEWKLKEAMWTQI